MARCKVCSSDLVEQINEKILAGISFVDISEWCKANDFDCSHMSIKRHVDGGHIQQPVHNEPTQATQPVQTAITQHDKQPVALPTQQWTYPQLSDFTKKA